MFTFNSGSGWSLDMELECFLIYKKLENSEFLYGEQIKLCRELSSKSNLSFESINAKVGNFKSEAGITNESNSSKATKYLMENYGGMSLLEAESLLKGYLLCMENNQCLTGM